MTTMEPQQAPHREITKFRGEESDPFESNKAKQDCQTSSFSKTAAIIRSYWNVMTMIYCLQILAFPMCSLMFNSHIYFWYCKQCSKHNSHCSTSNSGCALPGYEVELKPNTDLLYERRASLQFPCAKQSPVRDIFAIDSLMLSGCSLLSQTSRDLRDPQLAFSPPSCLQYFFYLSFALQAFHRTQAESPWNPWRDSHWLSEGLAHPKLLPWWKWLKEELDFDKHRHLSQETIIFSAKDPPGFQSTDRHEYLGF